MTRAIEYPDRSPKAIQAWKLLPEGVLAEVIDDALYFLSSPTPYHQRVCGKLYVDLANYVLANQLGEVFHCPVDIYLEGEKSVVVPDIAFVARDNNLIIDNRGLHGPPDVLIEVLSPSTSRRDFTIKKDLYERTGVKEYWSIDPTTKDARGFLKLQGRYGEPIQLKSHINVHALDRTFAF
jgi:Uma2 family endonuclease